MKYSVAFDRDWNFYLQNRKKFSFCGETPLSFVYKDDAIDAKQAFYIFDSQGKFSPTCEPGLLSEIISCKKAINMQIKQWAEGYDDCMIGREEYLSEFSGEIPFWVNQSFKNQILKQYEKI